MVTLGNLTIDDSTWINISTRVGFLLCFRELVAQGMSEVFGENFVEVPNLIAELTKSLEGSDDLKSVTMLSNQIGNIKDTDGMIKWAVSINSNAAKDQSIWTQLPAFYAYTTWLLSSHKASIYDMRYDGNFNL